MYRCAISRSKGLYWGVSCMLLDHCSVCRCLGLRCKFRRYLLCDRTRLHGRSHGMRGFTFDPGLINSQFEWPLALQLDKFFDLCNDGVWGVRKACAECFTQVSRAASPHARRQKLTTYFIGLVCDQSRWVRLVQWIAISLLYCSVLLYFRCAWQRSNA